VSALAVTPTILDCTQSNIQSLLVFNTLSKETRFNVSGAYQGLFTLQENQSKLITFECNEINYLKIEEIYSENLRNAILIPVITDTPTKSIPVIVYIASASLLGLAIYGFKRRRTKKLK
jgi:hypothetical protein